MASQRSLSDILSSVPRANRWKLDKEIDFEHKTSGGAVSKHLGRIADSMTGWEGAVADNLNLTGADRSHIRKKYHSEPKLQRREALEKWKSRLGKEATYQALIKVFYEAGELTLADLVCDLFKNDEPDGLENRSAISTCHTVPSNQISFSPSMGPELLAQWLLQEYGADYSEDVEQIKKAKINGKLLLTSMSKLVEKLELSLGFEMQLKGKVEQLKDNGSSPCPELGMLPSNTAASLPPCHTPMSDDIDDGMPQAGMRSKATTLSIHLLSMLKTKSGDKINIIDQIAPHWSDFALKLDFDRCGGTIQTIEKKCHYDPKDCCREVMQLWLKGKGSRQPATWKLLVEILRECDLNTLAGQVQSALEFN